MRAQHPCLSVSRLSVSVLVCVCVLTSNLFSLAVLWPLSPDRSYALAGSWDGALYIWDVDTGKLESSLRGPHW